MAAVISDSGHLIPTIQREARGSDFILLHVCCAPTPPPAPKTTTGAAQLWKIWIIPEHFLRRIPMN